jgi:hypothetical protein
MSLTISTEHVQTALSRLLYQFKDKPTFEAFITALIQQLQDAENAVSGMLYLRQVDTATGENLDILGRIVGQQREGRDDDSYRLWIKARIQINKSSGLTEEIYNVLKLITGFLDTGDFQIEERTYPASFQLTIVPGVGTIDIDSIYEIINLMRSATVDFALTYHITDPGFRFDIGSGFDTGHLAGIL